MHIHIFTQVKVILYTVEIQIYAAKIFFDHVQHIIFVPETFVSLIDVHCFKLTSNDFAI